jgi:hypothetical protein
MLLGAFRGGNPLERIVGVPFLWPRPRGVVQGAAWAFLVYLIPNSPTDGMVRRHSYCLKSSWATPTILVCIQRSWGATGGTLEISLRPSRTLH